MDACARRELVEATLNCNNFNGKILTRSRYKYQLCVLHSVQRPGTSDWWSGIALGDGSWSFNVTKPCTGSRGPALT